MRIAFGGREVGDGLPVYIVFEAGPTHTGLEMAKELARHVRDAGGDAIKFQITDHDRLIQDRGLMFDYKVLDEDGGMEEVSEPLFDIWQRRYMVPDEWKELKAYCDEIGLHFFATIFSPEDVDLMVELGCDSIKIASQDTNYRDLIEYAARQGLPVQLDTGSHSLGEVERAVDWIRQQGNNRILINHCPSGYPAHTESIHLRMIRTYKEIFPYPVAFSDHTPGWRMDVAAVAAGANIVEKTITLDRTQRSPEHLMSLEPPEMREFVEIIREVEAALGQPRREISRDQLEKREATRRSAYLVRPVKAGERLRREDIEFRRPGYGIKPDEYQRFLGLTYRVDLQAGAMLKPEHL